MDEGRDDESRPLPLRHRKIWGRRNGPKLSAYQQSLVDTLLPYLAVEPDAGCDPRDYFASPAEPESLKPPAAPLPPPASVSEVWLEVGFGGGEHAAWQAQANPHVGVIGCEPYISGVAKLLTKIVDDNIPNIRLYTEDARDVIAALPDASLGRAFVLFPDPWPKTRHHKRRFIQTEMLDQFARVLREGAELRFATDDPGYRIWALERAMAHPKFRWLAESAADWRARPGDWPQTRYEAKALHGVPSFFRFVRTA